MSHWPSYAAWLLGLVPLAWLEIRRRCLQWNPRRDWLIAAAYGVSFLADTGGLLGWPDLAGNVYPLSQAALIGYALLERRQAVHLLGLLTLVAVCAIGWRGVEGRDVLLSTVASLTIAGLAMQTTTGVVRAALLVSFGVGTLAWLAYAALPGWPTWGIYQGTRLLGTLAFCWATGKTEA